ncbi:acetyltransferase [Sphingobium sp. OAS761]|uniref:acetate--CoA ligase family protein n=1 Tax=Sphingobium sp. OAS761 TaxID=2817901 RepID=UPI0020A20A77|nr:acetate--CoA ligase family protein [Sphingobium sp. OAS761]MCP1471267.1 acetyltransferase [Sphingobium sp. OAS761]
MEKTSVLQSFFNPRSIAVVGAADDPAKMRGKLLKITLASAYAGPVHPVHPKGGIIQGQTAYTNLTQIPGGADLVMIATPGPTVPGVVREAVSAGAKAAVILSSGVDMDELADAIGDSGLRYMGPNCEGYIALDGAAATFAAVADAALAAGRPPRRPGRKVSIVSQSGGLGFALFGRGIRENLDFHAVVTTGNEGDLESLDFVDHLLDEGETGVLIMFIEGLKSPARFAEVASKAADKGVPIVMMKIGRSEAGQRAAVSHTAHLTGADTAYDAVFERYGVIRVFDQEELLSVAAALARFPHVPIDKVAIVSTSGGAGGWAADLCGIAGLDVPVLSEALQADLSQWIPEFGSTANPVDVTANAVEAGGVPLVHVLERLQDSDEVDAFIVNIGLHASNRIAKLADILGPVLARARKPILFTSHIVPIAENMAALADLGGQGFHSYTGCAAALKGIGRYAAFQADWQRRGAIPPAAAPQLVALKPGVLDEADTAALITAYDIPIPPTALAKDRDAAAREASAMGFPVVLKIQSPDISHKTEAGGVRLGVREGEVEAAFDEIMANAEAYDPEAKIEGILIQKMMPKGHEVVIGVIRDPDFGPLVMIGSGGIYLEVLKDVVFAPPPISPDEARRLILSLKTAAILKGVRGQKAADIDALAKLVSRVSELARTETRIEQIDFNPVFVYPEGDGVVAVDALAVAIDPNAHAVTHDHH